MHQDWAAMVVMISGCLMVFSIVRVLSTNRSRREAVKAQQDLQTRLLEKFGSAPELSAFLQTEAGESFVKGVQSSPPNAMARILTSVQSGLLTFVLGIAFLMLEAWLKFDEPVFAILGTICVALGIGFLASSFVSYRLSKSLNILPGNGTQGGSRA